MLAVRLRAALPRDRHAGERGVYTVRSLYFDTPRDRALREKIDGVDRREKFRIRMYDGDDAFIRLEKKRKRGGLGWKTMAPLTREETCRILAGNIDWMKYSPHELIVELYARMRGQLLRPKTIVEYDREPFTFGPGNVRITLDSGLRSGLSSIDFFDTSRPMLAAGDAPVLLEVKYDAFLPDSVRMLLAPCGRRAAAFSKYAACRMYD